MVQRTGPTEVIMKSQICFRYTDASYFSPAFEINSDKLDWFFDCYLGGEYEHPAFWGADIFSEKLHSVDLTTVDFLKDKFCPVKSKKLSKIFNSVLELNNDLVKDFSHWTKNSE